MAHETTALLLVPDILIRRPTEADGPGIEAMFARCSRESWYARFLAPQTAFPPDHLARILTPAPGNEAWVGVTRADPDTVVALGSWARRGTDAELALIVEDSWQRRGIGKALLTTLSERAWSSGVCRLTAWVLRDSRHVFRMLRALVGCMTTRPDAHVSEVTIERCAGEPDPTTTSRTSSERPTP